MTLAECTFKCKTFDLHKNEHKIGIFIFFPHNSIHKYIYIYMVIFFLYKTGVWSSAPHLLMWVFAIMTGWLSDYLISNGKLEILQQRRLFSTIGRWLFLNTMRRYYIIFSRLDFSRIELCRIELLLSSRRRKAAYTFKRVARGEIKLTRQIKLKYSL